jgi:Protein of unknown function (DUF2934)
LLWHFHKGALVNARQTDQGGQAQAMSQSKKLAHKTLSAMAESGARIMKSARRREMTPEERHQMIAEAAYFRALRRGFHGGSDLEDRLDSEAEIDKLMCHG